jgi:hypothetical protein
MESEPIHVLYFKTMSLFFWKPRRKKELELTPAEKALVEDLNFSKKLALAIKTKAGSSIDPLFESQWFDNYEHEPALKGIKCLLAKDLSTPGRHSMVKLLQANQEFSEYRIFSCGHYGAERDYYVGALKTHDQYDILRIFETNGLNYNLRTDDIIQFLLEWEQRVRFSIIDAYHDRVIIQFGHLEFDIINFAREALKICPDILSSVQNEKELKAYILKNRGEFDFWWD